MKLISHVLDEAREMKIEVKPIGYVSADVEEAPRSWDESDVERALVFDQSYIHGLRGLNPGQRIYVLF